MTTTATKTTAMVSDQELIDYYHIGIFGTDGGSIISISKVPSHLFEVISVLIGKIKASSSLSSGIYSYWKSYSIQYDFHEIDISVARSVKITELLEIPLLRKVLEADYKLSKLNPVSHV